MKYKIRKTWKNWGKNITAHPLRMYDPGSLKDLLNIVKEAEKLGVQVRAIGSGHSFTDVMTTTGFLVRPKKLSKILRVNQDSTFKTGVDTSHYFSMESGVTIKKVEQRALCPKPGPV